MTLVYDGEGNTSQYSDIFEIIIGLWFLDWACELKIKNSGSSRENKHNAKVCLDQGAVMTHVYMYLSCDKTWPHM